MIKQLELCGKGSQKTEKCHCRTWPRKKVNTVGMCLKSTLSNSSGQPLCPSWFSGNFLSRLNQICQVEPSSCGYCSSEWWGPSHLPSAFFIPRGQSGGLFPCLECCKWEACHMLCLQFPSQLKIPKLSRVWLVEVLKLLEPGLSFSFSANLFQGKGGHTTYSVLVRRSSPWIKQMVAF